MKTNLCKWTLVPLIALAMGCAEDLTLNPDDTASIDGVVQAASGSDDSGAAITTTTVNATDDEAWIYLDLDTADQMAGIVDADSGDWDIALQRFRIKSNGGVSGDGNVEVARVIGGDFQGMATAPFQGYVTDADDSDDEDTDPDYAFLGADPWFDYDPTDHTLSPATVVYVIQSTAGSFFKFEMLDYYDGAGTGGYPQFHWAAVAAPEGAPDLGPDELFIEATETDEWVHVKLTAGVLAPVPEPENSTEWDLAFSRTMIQTNSGTSGVGLGGAIPAPEGTWEDVTSSPTVGFVVDGAVPLPGPPGSGEYSGNPALADWYDYDPSTHVVSPRDQVYLIRTAAGGYAKLQLLSYDDGALTIRLAAVARVPQVWTDTIVAPDGEGAIYFQFDAGAEISVEEPATSLKWDLAVSGLQLQTNSGTSGAGEGGALDPVATSLEDVTSVPGGDGCYLMSQGHICDCEMTEEQCTTEAGIWTPTCSCATPFTEDETLPVPGPPGSGEYSGNSVLSGWYDYDPATHVVSPKAAAFLLKTAAGDFVKLQITSYDGGTYDIDWAYSGPGASTF